VSRNPFLGEADAYPLLASAGLRPPRHGLAGGPLPFAAGEPVVVKGLGEDLWHKSELGAVHFCAFEPAAVAAAVAAMRARVEAGGHRWLGGLVCERIAIRRNEGLPSEAMVSLVNGAAGWTVVCGVGGLQAEALAGPIPPLRWPVARVDPARACAEFRSHLLGRIWLGALRGTRPLTEPAKLAAFFQNIWRLVDRAREEGLELLEMNPVVLDAAGEPRPLDAVGRRTTPAPIRLGPPAGFLATLRAPGRIALAGVSAKPGSPGRTILENLRRYALPKDGGLLLIKPGHDAFLGLPCVNDVAALRGQPVDLLILAVPAAAAIEMVLQLLAQGGGAAVVALVSGGIGDGADTTGLGARLQRELQSTRAAGRWTPALLGPNFLGHWAPAACLDTSFIPTEKLGGPNPASGEPILLSQSGAFLLSRRSHLPELRFGLALALGNQTDVCFADVLSALAAEGPGGPIAAYLEGFGPGQLETAAAAIVRLRANQRRVLIHRAGRTNEGQAAAASHTGAMASDLVLEKNLLTRAGASLTDSIAEFDAALAWLDAYPHLATGPVALLTNAGFESVNGGDLFGSTFPAAKLNPESAALLAAILGRHELSGLVSPRLPLDLTPMADEAAFLDAADLLLAHAAVVVVGLVPFTRRLRTDRDGGRALAGALADLARRQGKPLAVAVDAGDAYAGFRAEFAAAGLPVFARTEDALLGLRVLS